MSAAGESSRSIAVELALLFLRELEPLVAEDPEQLVSTEAVLSFAAVRRGMTSETGRPPSGKDVICPAARYRAL